MTIPLQFEALGYDSFFEANRMVDFACIARVTAQHRGAYDIATLDGIHRAQVTGKTMQSAIGRSEYPAVGDWVVIHDDTEDVKTIASVMPRKTTFQKKHTTTDQSQLIAANVDVAFIVESIDRDFSLNRFERYVVLARAGGVSPVIVINKTDLISEGEMQTLIDSIHERFSDIPVIATSTLEQKNTNNLEAFMKPRMTYCFVGSSGVGKSSLINALLAEAKAEVGEIGHTAERGRHTTTARQLYMTKEGSIIIDNPGSRAVGVADATTGMEEVFKDIEALSRDCMFSNCLHINDPGCAILAAIKDGRIQQEQYDNYLSLKKESSDFSASGLQKRHAIKQEQRTITAKKHKRSKN